MMIARAVKKGISKPKAVKTVFKFFAPDAVEVSLAGNFNEWRERDILLKKDKNGYWSISLPLMPGRYEYRYLVDGNWAGDQNQAECTPNPFGTWNSVIEVQG